MTQQEESNHQNGKRHQSTNSSKTKDVYGIIESIALESGNTNTKKRDTKGSTTITKSSSSSSKTKSSSTSSTKTTTTQTTQTQIIHHHHVVLNNPGSLGMRIDKISHTGSIRVIKIIKGGQAEKAKLQVGDVLCYPFDINNKNGYEEIPFDQFTKSMVNKRPLKLCVKRTTTGGGASSSSPQGVPTLVEEKENHAAAHQKKKKQSLQYIDNDDPRKIKLGKANVARDLGIFILIIGSLLGLSAIFSDSGSSQQQKDEVKRKRDLKNIQKTIEKSMQDKVYKTKIQKECNLYVAKTSLPDIGRFGIFAGRHFVEGDNVLEESSDNSILFPIINQQQQQQSNDSRDGFLFLSQSHLLLNHHPYLANVNKEFKASRNITIGEEIFVDYIEDYHEHSDIFSDVPVLDDYQIADDIVQDEIRNQITSKKTTIKRQKASGGGGTVALRMVKNAVSRFNNKVSRLLPTSLDTLKLASLEVHPYSSTAYISMKNHSYHWLQYHGSCFGVDVFESNNVFEIIKTTIKNLGRGEEERGSKSGVFAKQFIKKGSIIAEVPLLVLANDNDDNNNNNNNNNMMMSSCNNSSLIDDEHQYCDDASTATTTTTTTTTGDEKKADGEQRKEFLHKNTYCFGHHQALLVFCPLTTVGTYINHASSSTSTTEAIIKKPPQQANVRFHWSKTNKDNKQAHTFQPKDVLTKFATKLSFDIIALQDIQQDEEILADLQRSSHSSKNNEDDENDIDETLINDAYRVGIIHDDMIPATWRQ